MKTFNRQGRQGDVLLTKIDALPDGLKKQKPENEMHIVTHSETGHHHVVSAKTTDMYQAANDPFTAYLVVNKTTELKHLREFDTHESHNLSPGIYHIRRQRQIGVEGWERVAD